MAALHVELLDPFGGVIAAGDFSVPDVPGADQHTPSLAQEVSTRLRDQRCSLVLEGYEGPPYSVRFT
jgi:hypothetical protein